MLRTDYAKRLTEVQARGALGAAVPGPLCVDLDGTLLRTDLLVESLLALLRINALYIFMFPLWLLRGRAYLKWQVAERTQLDVRLLPYHEPLLHYLREQRAAGRRLILITASSRKLAEAVASHLGCFDEVIASDDKLNLSGTVKAERLRARFGDAGFDYAGNAYSDLKVWRHAAAALVVNPPPGLLAAAKRSAPVTYVAAEPNRWKEYVRAMRPHQWLKNLLVFVPLAAAHRLQDLPLLADAILAFVAFCLCASSVYLLNDLLDLPSDRRHPRKRRRPFAAGTASIKAGAVLAPVLLAAAVAVALLLPWQFLAVLGGYYATTLAYSFWLKKKVMVDVFVLAGLYTVRVIAGAAAVLIPPSFWLLAFSMFVFLSLAMLKRYTELMAIRDVSVTAVSGRGYRAADITAISSMGAASGYLSALVLALYINSEAVRLLYGFSEAIWLLCPMMLYWISRMWQRAGRGQMHDDPIVFAVRDPISRRLGVAAVIVLLLASYG